MENKIIKVTDLDIVGDSLNTEGNDHDFLWICTILVLERPKFQ